MHSSFPGGTAADPKPSTTRVCVVATPRLFADTIARTMSLAGWQVDAVCTSAAELAVFERTLSEGHVAVLVDGAIPAIALGIELIRRRPGQRVVVVGDSPAPAGSGIVQIASSASVVDLIRQVSKFDGGQMTDRTLTPRHVEILQLVLIRLQTKDASHAGDKILAHHRLRKQIDGAKFNCTTAKLLVCEAGEHHHGNPTERWVRL